MPEFIVDCLHGVDINKEKNCLQSILFVVFVKWLCKLVQTNTIEHSRKSILSRHLKILLAYDFVHVASSKTFNTVSKYFCPDIAKIVVQHFQIVFGNIITMHIKVMKNRHYKENITLLQGNEF